MSLPYSIEVYFASMAEYNVFWLGAVLIGGLLAALAIALAVHPPVRMASMASRIIAAILATVWVWIGAVHQLGMMAELNFMAPVYGVVWIAEGILIAWFCLFGERVRFRFETNLSGIMGIALAVTGTVIYPLILIFSGNDWNALPVVGTAPNPTVIFTAGFLLAARERMALFLLIPPLGWAGVSGVSAYLLDHPPDYAVSIAVVIALTFALYARFTTPKASMSELGTDRKTLFN